MHMPYACQKWQFACATKSKSAPKYAMPYTPDWFYIGMQRPAVVLYHAAVFANWIDRAQWFHQYQLNEFVPSSSESAIQISVLLLPFPNSSGRDRARVWEVNKNDWHTVGSNMNLARFNFDSNSMPNTSFKAESSSSGNGCKRRNGASFQNVFSRETVLLRTKKKTEIPINWSKDKNYNTFRMQLHLHMHMNMRTQIARYEFLAGGLKRLHTNLRLMQ